MSAALAGRGETELAQSLLSAGLDCQQAPRTLSLSLSLSLSLCLCGYLKNNLCQLGNRQFLVTLDIEVQMNLHSKLTLSLTSALRLAIIDESQFS